MNTSGMRPILVESQAGETGPFVSVFLVDSQVTPITRLPLATRYKNGMPEPHRRLRDAVRATFVVLAVLSCAPAVAQETGTPVYSAPYRAFTRHELGISLSSPPHADIGLEGFYGFASGRNDWNLRLGYLDRESGSAVVAGAGFRSRLLTHSDDFPLDGALTVGVGATFNGGTVVRVPVGFSLGRRFNNRSSGISFVPYLQPVLLPTFGSDESDFGVALGLGLDMRLGKSFDLRVSGGFGDLEGFAVTAAWVR
jgi:hypothetical protein